MSYVAKTLLPDEKVIYAATLHWIIYLPGLLLVAGGGAFSVIFKMLILYIFGADVDSSSYRITSIISGVVVAYGIALIAGAYIRQNNTELAITDRRIIAKYGFISRSTFEIMLSRITGANFDQTILGRVFGYGTVIVHGAGGDISPFDVVTEPQEFQRALVSVLGQQGATMPQNMQHDATFSKK